MQKGYNCFLFQYHLEHFSLQLLKLSKTTADNENQEENHDRNKKKMALLFVSKILKLNFTIRDAQHFTQRSKQY